jgi:competence protein ComEA
LNRATAAELDLLPGIGPSLANAIVEYRQTHGPFDTVDQLLDVPGIGPSKLAAIRDLVDCR